MSACCASCALNRPCESGCDGHDHDHDHAHAGEVVGLDYVGDTGDDILNVLRGVDDFVSTAIIEPVLDALSTTDLGQYTNIISDIHDTRREAQERAAPRTGPGAIAGLGPSPVSPTAPTLAAPAPKPPAAPRSAFLAGLDGFGAALASGAISNTVDGAQVAAAAARIARARDTIRAIQTTVRASRRGDAAARLELVRMKDAAARGEPTARKQWATAVMAMKDDDASAARAAGVR